MLTGGGVDTEAAMTMEAHMLMVQAECGDADARLGLVSLSIHKFRSEPHP